MPDMNDVQAELMDMITKNESPSEISDKIKDMLFSKSAERVDAFKPNVANSLFNDDQQEEEDELSSSVTISLHILCLVVSSLQCACSLSN